MSTTSDRDTTANPSDPADPGVSSTGGKAASDFAGDSQSAASLGDSARAYVARLRGGDMGSLPAILGLVVLLIIFGLANSTFFRSEERRVGKECLL